MADLDLYGNTIHIHRMNVHTNCPYSTYILSTTSNVPAENATTTESKTIFHTGTRAIRKTARLLR